MPAKSPEMGRISFLDRARGVCATCALGGRAFARRYREFLLGPGTLVTPGSLLLIGKLPHLLGLSRRAVRVIKQNLAFSLGVLALAVALTVVGVLTPVTGALLHELSSIPVIANSARLIGTGDRDG